MAPHSFAKATVLLAAMTLVVAGPVPYKLENLDRSRFDATTMAEMEKMMVAGAKDHDIVKRFAEIEMSQVQSEAQQAASNQATSQNSRQMQKAEKEVSNLPWIRPFLEKIHLTSSSQQDAAIEAIAKHNVLSAEGLSASQHMSNMAKRALETEEAVWEAVKSYMVARGSGGWLSSRQDDGGNTTTDPTTSADPSGEGSSDGGSAPPAESDPTTTTPDPTTGGDEGSAPPAESDPAPPTDTPTATPDPPFTTSPAPSTQPFWDPMFIPYSDPVYNDFQAYVQEYPGFQLPAHGPDAQNPCPTAQEWGYPANLSPPFHMGAYAGCPYNYDTSDPCYYIGGAGTQTAPGCAPVQFGAGDGSEE